MKYLISESRLLQKNKICLEVDKSNMFALKLYNTLGFTMIGKGKEYYENGEGPILMDYKL